MKLLFLGFVCLFISGLCIVGQIVTLIQDGANSTFSLFAIGSIVFSLLSILLHKLDDHLMKKAKKNRRTTIDELYGRE